MKYIDADALKAKLDEHYRKNQNKYMETRTPYTQGLIDALDLAEQVIDSLQQEPIEKDEETEKLIVCDIIEATIARINGGKKDEEKEENIMREKIAYLRDLGFKGK